MQIIITITDSLGDYDYKGDDLNFKRWVKMFNEGETRIPVVMHGEVYITRLLPAGSPQVAECIFTGALQEGTNETR